MAIYSGFTHEKLWFSIVMLVYQKSTAPQLRCQPIADGAHSKTRESRVEISRIGRTGMALSETAPWAAPGAF